MKALTNKLIVKIHKEEGITDSGIITHLKADDKRRFATVKFDAKLDFTTNENRRVQKTIPAGTDIFIELYCGKGFEYEGETLRLIEYTDVKSYYSQTKENE